MLSRNSPGSGSKHSTSNRLAYFGLGLAAGGVLLNGSLGVPYIWLYGFFTFFYLIIFGVELKRSHE